jgi:hypothetical protein
MVVSYPERKFAGLRRFLLFGTSRRHDRRRENHACAQKPDAFARSLA